MLSLLRHAITAAALGFYIPSKYDTYATNYSSELASVRGYATDHNAPNNIKKFGDLSIITLNAFVGEDIIEGIQAEAIIDLFDTHHPTIFGLQGLSKDSMESIKDKIQNHYSVACDDKVEIDIRTREMLYKPIFYDKEVLERIYEDSFDPSIKNETYATFAVFRRNNSNQIFMVINADLFSADPGAIDVQFFNIIAHQLNSHAKDFPFFFLGTINTIGPSLRRVLKSMFLNLVEKDSNNRKESLNTFHGQVEMNDGVQRDFVLLNDRHRMFLLNYTRILNHWNGKDFAHYPIYSILSFNKPWYDEN